MSALTPGPRRPRPTARGWVYIGPTLIDGVRALVFERKRIRVLSSMHSRAKYPVGDGAGPQWHISVSRIPGHRASAREVGIALRAFGMSGAEEDNHHPGVARHYWLPVDPAFRVGCECKVEEVTIVEPDGYSWTNPREGSECRGCEYEVKFGRPCPFHGDPAPAEAGK